MRWSESLVPTLRESPAEPLAEGERLLIRAGYLRRAGGERVWLPFGARAMARIEALAAAATGAQLLGPGLSETAALGLALSTLRSHRQLPQVWRQGASTYWAGREPDAAAYARVFAACGLGVAWPALPEAPERDDPEGDLAPTLVHTPGAKSIAEVCAFLGVPDSAQMKSLVLNADGSIVLALVRGDHQASEALLCGYLGCRELRPASAVEIERTFGASAGSLGPVGLKGVRIVADFALRGRRNMICGANRDDYHLRNVTPGEDFDAVYTHVRAAGAAPPAALWLREGAFKVVNERGAEAAMPLGGVSCDAAQMLLAAAEENRDGNGLRLPAGIAPFAVVVTPVKASEAALKAAAESLYAGLRERSVDVIVDDRDESPGVKFKDADLTGIPLRLNAGRRVAEGFVELCDRRAGTKEDVAIAAAVEAVVRRVKENA
jgi:prolyl-tRNA synthetase